MKEALAVFEEEKYSEMHKIIMNDDGYPRLQ